jgi:beta-barrel assembly-enhancing protease
MKKIIFQGLTVIFLFFAVWAILYQVDWMSLFRVEKITKTTEEKLGNMLWDIFKKNDREITDPVVTNTVDSLLSRICTKNKIDRRNIRMHVLKKEDVNAFALPGGRIVLYSGLISSADNPDEVIGVIAHELAHLQLDHVMKKLIKEVGLSVILSMTTGSSGADMARETARIISSTAYDRSLEREADLKAVDYLLKAGIDPAPFANFFYKLSSREPDALKYLSIISTHPNLEERAAYIIEYSKNKHLIPEQVISEETWESMLEKL